MSNFLKRLENNLERWLCLGFYVMVAFVLCLEIIQRSISFSTIWGEEIARYCFIYLAWIGAAYAVKDRAHLRIDILVDGMPNRIKAALYVFGGLLAIGLACLAFWLSIHPLQVSMKFSSETAGLRVPFWWFKLAIPIGFGLIILRLLQALVRDIMSLVNNQEIYEGVGVIDG